MSCIDYLSNTIPLLFSFLIPFNRVSWIGYKSFLYFRLWKNIKISVVGGRAFGHPEKTQQKYCAQEKTQQEYCATAGCGRSADRWMDFWIRYADRRRFTKHGGLGNRPIDHRRISGRATDLWVELTDQ